MTEGLLLYLEGNEEEGMRLMLEATSQNRPEYVQKYVELLKTLRTVPGAKKYMEPLGRVMAVLESNSPSAEDAGRPEDTKSPNPPVGSRDDQRVTELRTADTDPKQVRHGLVATPRYSNPQCEKLFGTGTRCAAVTVGPLFVTDLRSVGGQCMDHFVALLHDDNEFAALPFPLSIHGARLVLAKRRAMILVKPKGQPSHNRKNNEDADESESRVSRCGLLWSGYVPYDSVESATSSPEKEPDNPYLMTP